MAAGPSLKGPNCGNRRTAWLGSMSIALWLQVEGEGHPVHSSAGDHGGSASVCPSLQEFTQSRVQFTEGGADPGNHKTIE